MASACIASQTRHWSPLRWVGCFTRGGYCALRQGSSCMSPSCPARSAALSTAITSGSTGASCKPSVGAPSPTLVHLAHGHDGPQDPATEARVQEEAARLLIPIEMLLDALRWTSDPVELAAECWVDVRTLTVRLESLTLEERAQVDELARTIEDPA